MNRYAKRDRNGEIVEAGNLVLSPSEMYSLLRSRWPYMEVENVVEGEWDFKVGNVEGETVYTYNAVWD